MRCELHLLGELATKRIGVRALSSRSVLRTPILICTQALCYWCVQYLIQCRFHPLRQSVLATQ